MKHFILLIVCNILLSFQMTSNAQWVQLNTGTFLTIFSLSAVDSNTVWACASGPNIFRTTNGGNSWQNVGTSVPINGVETSIFALDANNALFATYEGFPVRNSYVFKTTDGGSNWTQVFSQGQNAFISGIWMRNFNDGFMVGWPVGGRWSLWRTSNGGSSWDSTGLYIPETNPDVWSFENALFSSGSEIWFGARGKGIYHSTNFGNSWTLQTVPGFVYPSAIWIDDDYGLSSGALNIINTTDAGSSWNNIPNTAGTEVLRGIVGINNEWWHVREIDPNIYYSSDYGNTWSVQYTAPDNTGFRHVTRSRTGNVLWAANINGKVYKYFVNVVPVELTSFTAKVLPGAVELNWSTATETNNRGFEIQRNITGEDNSWLTIGFKEGSGTSLTPVNYTFSDNNVPVGRDNISYRLKQLDYNGEFTYSNIETVEPVPSQFSLEQNYPNPFNPSTRISYSITASGFVSLKIYDVLGKEISSPVSKYQDAGNYTIEFKAENLPSGIYLYKLEAGGNTLIRKMSLVK